MKWNLNRVASLVAIAFGIYGLVIENIYVLNYGMLGAIVLTTWETMVAVGKR